MFWCFVAIVILPGRTAIAVRIPAVAASRPVAAMQAGCTTLPVMDQAATTLDRWVSAVMFIR